MRILLCNDDGVGAPGLERAAAAARALTDDVWIVAPEKKWTAASHRISFDVDLALTERSPRVFACSGTPADCVIAAMTVVDGGLAPQLVIAGINDKRNVGEDMAYSGTLAIAREASFWGVPAIALSRDAWPTDAAADTSAIGRLLKMLWSRRDDWLAPDTWLAVNLPEKLPAPIRQARLARDKIASATDVVSRAPGRIVYRLRRGRPGLAGRGDENDLAASGAIVVVRGTWRAVAPLPDLVMERWTGLLTS